MKSSQSLAEFPVGARGIVTHMTTRPEIAARLAQFGLIPGTEVECVLHGAGGSQAAFAVRGAVIALRKSDLREIRAKPLPARASEAPKASARTMLLIGNPNVGKSTVFNALTGMRQHTGNWCGKTVTGAVGHFTADANIPVTLVDTPGTYSLCSQTAEEAATTAALCNTPHDCVICVCDATALERGLILVLELLAMHRKAVLCVNLMDEARRRHISVDLEGLSDTLGIPVIGVTARKRKTLVPLVEAAMRVCEMPPQREVPPLVSYPIVAERALAPLTEAIAAELPARAMLSPRWLATQLLSSDAADLPSQGVNVVQTERVQAALQTARASLAAAQLSPKGFADACHGATVLRAEAMAQQYTSIPLNAAARDRAIDRAVTSRRFGIPLMLALLLLVFWITIVGANYPSAWLSAAMNALCDAASWSAAQLHLPWWLSGALIDGMLRGTGWVISVMLPPMAIFFPLFTLMEDAGILPRIAFNADRCFAGCRACGKQSLTMAMGFGCNAVGVTECRIIDSRRERLIAVLTNSFVPCNGRFPPRLWEITV